MTAPGAADDVAARAAFILGLRRRGVLDARALDAIERTPRARFLPDRHAGKDYADEALAIDAGQMATQPYVIAAALGAVASGSGTLCSMWAPAPAFPRR